jgi:hypothetical protein
LADATDKIRIVTIPTAKLLVFMTASLALGSKQDDTVEMADRRRILKVPATPWSLFWPSGIDSTISGTSLGINRQTLKNPATSQQRGLIINPWADWLPGNGLI